MTIRDGCLALALAAPLLLAAAPSFAEGEREGRLGFGEGAERSEGRGEMERPLGRVGGYVPRGREGAEERMEEREGGFLGGRSGEIRETEVEDD